MASGGSGPASARFTATPSSVLPAVVLTPQQVITDTDTQWVHIPLPWDNADVTQLQVCYQIVSATTGTTFVTQTRLTQMTLPNSAGIIVDNTSNRTQLGPICYAISTSFVPSGALTLGLRVVFGSTSDRIVLGQISLLGLTVA